MTTGKLEQAARQALPNFKKLYDKVMAAGNLGHQWTGLKLADDCSASIGALFEALDHSADTGNKVSDQFADAGKMVREPIGMVMGGELTGLVEEYKTGAWPIYVATAEPMKQEPVAWHEPNAYGNVTTHKKWALENGWLPLYTKE